MSLNWDITRVDNAEEVTAEGRPWEITEGLIWTTIGVGMPEITQANAEEFWTRMQMQSMAFGGPGLPYTLDDVKRRIGLKTNAIPKTKATFNAQLARQLRERAGKLREKQSK